MNCPSRPDDIESHPDWNQSPQDLNSDATTRADLNGVVNRRVQRDHESSINPADHQIESINLSQLSAEKDRTTILESTPDAKIDQSATTASVIISTGAKLQIHPRGVHPGSTQDRCGKSWFHSTTKRIINILVKYARFIGPSFIISVAYIDPGNYATDVGAGASTKYAHLFVVLLSNLLAIFLQSLCIKLGSVTGLDLAENCRKNLPRWMLYILYVLSEGAIIATDVAEVIGTAIALNLLLKIPLVAGCAISVVDVFLLLLFYNPNGTMARLRVFEYFVIFLVLGVVVCFCIQLSYIRNTSIGEVFRGYLPSTAIVEGDGVYLSCGIIGATVMPHSLFLGSGVVQPRLRQFDEQNSSFVVKAEAYEQTQDLNKKYRPTIGAIRSCLKYSVVELIVSLFSFALFVNSAILIVAGSSLYENPDAPSADLFGIHDLLVRTISPAAGILFALALLLSGTSAGLVCTMAGQMVSEGMICWKIKPWIRRLATRSISIIPSIIIAGAVGRKGLNQTLNASQVALSVALPFVTAPLLWFTCKTSIMTVSSDENGHRIDGEGSSSKVNMRNGWLVVSLSVLIWLLLVVMNVALIVLAAMGKA